MILIKNIIIVTQNAERQIINNSAILIEGEKIADLGENKNLEKKYVKAKKRVIDGRGQVAIPGLINAHTHAAMNLLRGFADDMPLKDWLEQKIWPAEAKMTPRDIYQGTKLACREMLQSGTTAFFDMYWYPEAIIKAVYETGIRGFVGPLIIDLGAVAVGPKQIEALYNKAKQKLDERIKLTIAPHAIYTVSEETLRWCRQFADANNLLIHIHLSETEHEVQECQKKHGLRPVEYLEKIGFLTPPAPSPSKGEGWGGVVAAHGCWLSDAEIKILAKCKVSVAHCPTSNLKLVSGVMPLSKLLRADVNVALGTDGSSSNNNLDMLEEMKIAALIHKWNEKNPAAADAQTVLDLATINGAKALKMDKEIGSIDIGKQADIVIVNFDQPHLRPCHSVVSNLVYSAQGGDVAKVIVGGQVLF